MTARVTAGDVNDRIDGEILPELHKQTGQLNELKVKLDILNGPTREAMIALAKVSDKLIELATDRTRADELLAARSLLRSQSLSWRRFRRVVKGVGYTAPWILLLGQIAGVLPYLWRLVHH